jgi:hypothetical protein
MKKNIIIVGDSFCASPTGWPSTLATALDLTLISHGQGGQSWWNVKKFIETIDKLVIEQTEVIVFVHTNADRIPTHNTQIGLINHSARPTTDIEIAVQLYYKYIHDPEFLNWAQCQWFLEINQRWGHKKIVHLHSFPWSIENGKSLAGLNISTNLCSISLNELGIDKFELFNDLRANHLSEHNNNELAMQLAKLIQQYKQETIGLNTGAFDLKITKWFKWS